MTDESSHSDLIEALVSEFIDRKQRGENPTIKEYCAKYPDLADKIRQLFPTLIMMEDLKPSLDSTHAGGGVPSTVERIGDYRILGEIGRGGMGVVYEAEQESLGRRVALKVLSERFSDDDSGLVRFQREARAAAKMHHTNIVPVFEIGQESGYIFYAMQLIQGQSLDQVIKELVRLRADSEARKKSGRRGDSAWGKSAPTPVSQDRDGTCSDALARSLRTDRFRAEALVTPPPSQRRPGSRTDSDDSSSRQGDTSAAAVLSDGTDLSTTGSRSHKYYRSVAKIGRQVADALAYSHARGIIHRDIKPSNLLLDAGGVIWITDFGIAKSDDQNITHTGDIVGTIRYMSPERFRGRCDELSDVYALGLTLYELAVLKPAFDSTDRLELIEMIKESEPAAARSIDPHFPIDLETIILKAIEKEPASRYESAEDIEEDLRRFIEDEPIKARRVSIPGRLLRWARRNRRLAVSLSAVALLIIVLVVVSTVAALYFSKAEDTARRNLYFAEMNVAGVASIERDGLGRVVELTDRWRPANAGVDYRGWEWYYLQSQVEHDAFTFSGIEGYVWDTAWSPDGTLVASTFPGGFHVWDMARKQRSKTLRVHAGMTFAIAWSPDGSRLASGSGDSTIKIWNVSTWEEAISLEGCQEGAEWWNVAWSPSGSMVAASSEDKVTGKDKVMTWDATTGKRLYDILPGSGAFCWTPDESQLVIAGHDAIEVWDVQTAARIGTVGQHHPIITSVRRSPDGTRLASSSDDGTVRIWDGQRIWAEDETPQPIHILSGHTNNVLQAKWSPDGRWLASASRDGTVGIWDAATGEVIRTLRGHSNDVLTVSWSPDGKQLASAGKDGTLKIWNFDSEQSAGAFVGHTNQVWNVCWSPDGDQLASASWDKTVKIWDRATGLAKHDLEHSAEVRSVSWSPDGLHLASGAIYGTVTVWNATTGSLEKTFQGSVNCYAWVDWSSDGQWLASLGADGKIRIWDFESGREMVFPGASAGGIETVRLSRGGEHFADGVGHIVRVWDLISSDGKPRELEGNAGGVAGIGRSCNSPDGRRFITGGRRFITGIDDDCTVLMWDASTVKCTHILRGHSRNVTAADWSPDGERIATVGMDGKLKIWDSATGRTTLTLQGKDSMVFGVRWSPDGRSIATVGDHKTITIWDASKAYERERP